MYLQNFRTKRQIYAINLDGSMDATYTHMGIDQMDRLLGRKSKNLPPGAVRSAPGDGILCSVYARSESSSLTDRQYYRMRDNAN